MDKRILCLILVLGLAGTASADLVGYWPLDGNGLDASGNENNGTINGTVEPAPDRFDNPEGAMSFAGGGGDNINVGDPEVLQLTGAMTITAWVYLDSTSPVHPRRNGRILAKMGPGGGGRSWSTGIEQNVEGVPLPGTIQVSSNGGDVVGLHDDDSLPVDEWVHFAGVYTPGTSLQVYLNGDLNATLTADIPASQFSDNGQSVLIGNRPACGDCGWYGSLDEVRIYDEALTQEEIQEIMDFTPSPAELGDVNLDGEVNGLDVDPFVGLVTSGGFQTEADMNEDGAVNGLDVDPFVAAVVGGGVQAVPEPSTLILLALGLSSFIAWQISSRRQR
jgi:hypothetical protein